MELFRPTTVRALNPVYFEIHSTEDKMKNVEGLKRRDGHVSTKTGVQLGYVHGGERDPFVLPPKVQRKLNSE
jgi:hypothetical protein